jgi:hypothetical protein
VVCRNKLAGSLNEYGRGDEYFSRSERGSRKYRRTMTRKLRKTGKCAIPGETP